MDTLNWIQQWYASQCDGDWGHTYGLEIGTLDNPGWTIKIDLIDTKLEKLSIEYKLIENSESDWYGFDIKDGKYSAAGDPSKLEFLLEKFKEIVENNRK